MGVIALVVISLGVIAHDRLIW